jgi:hypothetical protein
MVEPQLSKLAMPVWAMKSKLWKLKAPLKKH